MRAAIFALEARGLGRGRNAEQNHAHLQRHRLFGQVQQRLVVPGQGGGGGLRVGVHETVTPTPATFQPRSDHGRRPIQLCNIRKVTRAGHGACAVGVAHLLFDVRCRRSTTSTRSFLRMFRKSCLTWHLGAIGGSSVNSSKKKNEDSLKDSAFREEQVGSKSLRTTGSIQRPLPCTDLILPSGVAPCLVWTRGLIFNRGFPILYQGVLSRDFQRISAKSWATRLPASFPLPRSLESKHKKINTPKNRPFKGRFAFKGRFREKALATVATIVAS